MHTTISPSPPPSSHLPLKGKRILSLALNVPGPVAIQRLLGYGAECSKLEPPAGDPMRSYSPLGYAALHENVAVRTCDLKSPAGQAELHAHLRNSDMLISAFRPSALRKLGLDFASLQPQHPHLHMVAILGGTGALAEEAGHDLTYVAQCGLLPGLAMPPSLFADMAGALMATEAALACFATTPDGQKPQGQYREIALNQAAAHLALPRAWGLMGEGDILGGGLPAYRVYRCADGRVALAALEPHFLQRVVQAVNPSGHNSADNSATPLSQAQLTAYFSGLSCQTIDAWARQHDIPLYTMPDGNTPQKKPQ